ncbi:dTDP-4-amino-4,6-dideoxygalactose transaminase [Dokdonia sp. Hel_I_63]|uniref:DegT/DnrJ/EryC1/StrS family aminotransferase n=1 Tax=Dokdonia sp. Hel_I_63 TaxID=1249996 RepID=UPI00119AD022|nr:DegT/DnrJ/EryC1/StrS family aminotransferase [Dokdonia sp. Hel_I_63]TVZ23010.1 dTDP-4-amino-4,6-dideoxygalactose transaminase [Dokdonia sp. Hel_I_63]
MNNSKIWLSSPHMGGTEQNYVKEAFDSNWVAPLGANVNGFESDLEKYQGEDTLVAALSSGTAAIHLALIQCGVTHGDEVICQSFTFCGSINPIIYQGATPILVDSEPDTWNICPKYLEKAIEDRIRLGKTPKAIVAVHLYGMPYKIDEVHAIADRFSIPIIEDSAEALGSTFKGQKCGTFGRFGILSFNGNKIITTSVGGAMVCNSKKDKDYTVFLATQARDEAAHYEHTAVGYNYRMSNITAGIGRGQMEVLEKHINLRRGMHTFYERVFKNISGVKVFTEPNSDYHSNHWLSAIIVDPEKTNGITREDMRIAFAKADIESRPLWKPMHMQPIFKDTPYYGNNVAEELFNEGLCLPSGSNLTDADRDRIEKAIFDLFK